MKSGVYELLIIIEKMLNLWLPVTKMNFAGAFSTCEEIENYLANHSISNVAKAITDTSVDEHQDRHSQS